MWWSYKNNKGLVASQEVIQKGFLTTLFANCCEYILLNSSNEHVTCRHDFKKLSKVCLESMF